MSGRITPATSTRCASAPTSSSSSRADTELRKAGAEWVGRCPFHEERTPSFYVNPVKKVYHCYGCGAGGDVIDYVRERHALDFVGAVEWLAERFNVQLEYEEESPEVAARRRGEDRRRELLAPTAAFYHRVLRKSPLAEGARAYLTERGVTWEMAERFQLGFSPDEHAGHRGRAQAAASPTASSTRRESRGEAARGPVDRMAGRLIFTLFDTRGRPIAFAGRRLPPRRVGREVRQLAREPALEEGLDALRPAPRAHGDREGGGGDRRRGLHRRDRARAGRLRERRRLDGNGTDAAPVARAAQARAQRRPALRRRRGGQRGGAARPRARRAADGPARARRAAAARLGSRPRSRRRPRGGRRMLARRRACSPSASRSCSTRRTPARRSGATRPTRRCSEIFRGAPATPERDELVRLAASRLFLDRSWTPRLVSRPARAARGRPEREARARLRWTPPSATSGCCWRSRSRAGERGIGDARARSRPRRSRTTSCESAHAWVRARLNQDDAPSVDRRTTPRGGTRGACGTTRGARGAERRWQGASSRAGSNVDWNPSRRSSQQPR